MSPFQDKNLLAISDCVHYLHEGKLCNKNPIYTKQMCALYSLFGNVTLIAPKGKLGNDFHKLSYYNDIVTLTNLTYVATPNVGGNSLLDKLKIAKTFYTWIKLFWEHKNSDLIYLRMPNNLNIISFLLYFILSKKIFITYTGTWSNYKCEPFSYRLQKWFISKLHNGVAFIYSLSDTTHMNDGRIIASYSPSSSKDEIENLIEKRKDKELDSSCIKLLSVGAVVKYKNQLKSLEVIKFLNEQGINAQISFAGKLSDYHNELLHYIKVHKLVNKVFFYGHLSATELQDLFISHDFLIHTPIIEGYGKTIQEGFLYGLPAILTNFPYANYFKGGTNRVHILTDSAVSYMGLLDYINQLCTSKVSRSAVLQDINTFLIEHSIENWVCHYQKAIQENLIEPNVS